MDYQYISYHVEDRLCRITLNRPNKRNALNEKLVGELKDAFYKAETAGDVKVIILKANGAAFSAGADLEYLKSLQQNSLAENLADSRHLMELFRAVYLNKKVVIAQIEGHAIAGGCGLATVCDFCFSVPEASFGYTEVKIGFIPAIVMVFLIRKIGEGRAKAMLLTGRLISADEAKGIGLINEVIDPRDMEIFVHKFASRMCSNSSAQSLSSTKEMIAVVQNLPLDDALEYAARMNAEARQSEDCKKGIYAFLQKEKVKW